MSAGTKNKHAAASEAAANKKPRSAEPIDLTGEPAHAPANAAAAAAAHASLTADQNATASEAPPSLDLWFDTDEPIADESPSDNDESPSPQPPSALLADTTEPAAAAAAVDLPPALPDGYLDEDDDDAESIGEPDQSFMGGSLRRFNCDSDRDTHFARRAVARVVVAASSSSSSSAAAAGPGSVMINGRAWFKSQPDTAPSSCHKWSLVGVFIASRYIPDLPFFVPFARDSNDRLSQPVPYRLMMHWLDSSVPGADRRQLLLSVRVFRRVGPDGELVGDERYMCRDIAECALPADVVCGYAATFGAWCSMPGEDPPGTVYIEDGPNKSRSMLAVSRAALIELHKVPAHPSYTEEARVFLAAMLAGRAVITECIYELTPHEAKAFSTAWVDFAGYVLDRGLRFCKQQLAQADLLDFHVEPVADVQSWNWNYVAPRRFVDGWGTQFAHEPPLTEVDRGKRIRFTCVGYDITNRDALIPLSTLPPARQHPREERRAPSPPPSPIPTYPPLLDDLPSMEESNNDEE